jgi:hypothetical protein
MRVTMVFLEFRPLSGTLVRGKLGVLLMDC